jgi:hypothetical protein
MKNNIIFLVVSCVFLNGDFIQKWSIPDGKNAYGRVLVGEINYNGLSDIVVRRNQPIKVMFYELDMSNQWQLQDSIVGGGDHLLWAFGDFDLDGLSDVVFQKTFGIPTVGIAIYESPDSFSYPTEEVWRDTVGQAVVTPISVCDIDRDGIPEIVKVGANGVDFVIYESIENNLYEIIYEDTIQGILTPTSTLAFGDFDGDSKIEFVLGNLSDGVGAAYWLYEAPADNTYDFIHLGSVPTKNIKDCFSVPDADLDGKIEFVVKGYWVYGTIDAFIFEAIGDNTYEIIKTFNFPGGDYHGGYSEAGDVDGDSIPEIVLEARQNVFIIKAAGNDSFYVWDTLPGNSSGSSIAIYDIDGNGLKEIVISGNDETRIYEYDPGGIEETRGKKPKARYRLEVFPNPFSKLTYIKFQAPSSKSQVTLSIYDVSGRMVRQFDYKTIRLSDQVIWDGGDEVGRVVPVGVYFVQVRNRHTGATICEKVLKVK